MAGGCDECKKGAALEVLYEPKRRKRRLTSCSHWSRTHSPRGKAKCCGVILPIQFKPCLAHKTTRANSRPVNCLYAMRLCWCAHVHICSRMPTLISTSPETSQKTAILSPCPENVQSYSGMAPGEHQRPFWHGPEPRNARWLSREVKCKFTAGRNWSAACSVD